MRALFSAFVALALLALPARAGQSTAGIEPLVRSALNAAQTNFATIEGPAMASNTTGQTLFHTAGLRLSPPVEYCFLVFHGNLRELYCRLQGAKEAEPQTSAYAGAITSVVPWYFQEVCAAGLLNADCRAWKNPKPSKPSISLVRLKNPKGGYAFTLLVQKYV